MQGKVLADRLCKMGCLNQGITFDDYSTPFYFKIYNLTYCDYIVKIWCFDGDEDEVVFVSNTSGEGFKWVKETMENDEFIDDFMVYIKKFFVSKKLQNIEGDFDD